MRDVVIAVSGLESEPVDTLSVSLYDHICLSETVLINF